MAGKERLVIFPSRANHVFMKQRFSSAIKGLSLLKRKRDALEIKLREISIELSKNLKVVEEIMQEAIFSMAKANYLNTDFKPATVLAPKKADMFMHIKNTKVVGLVVPTFELVRNTASSLPLTGLSRGGTQVEVIRKHFQDAVEVLISLASLQYAVKVLQEGVRQNNMRVNGLEYVLIPRFQNTINYIRDELDEYEREDFYRLKRSQAKQRKAKDQFSQLIKQKNRERELESKSQFIKKDIDLPGTMLHTFDIDEFENTIKEKTPEPDYIPEEKLENTVQLTSQNPTPSFVQAEISTPEETRDSDD